MVTASSKDNSAPELVWGSKEKRTRRIEVVDHRTRRYRSLEIEKRSMPPASRVRSRSAKPSSKENDQEGGNGKGFLPRRSKMVVLSQERTSSSPSPSPAPQSTEPSSQLQVGPSLSKDKGKAVVSSLAPQSTGLQLGSSSSKLTGKKTTRSYVTWDKKFNDQVAEAWKNFKEIKFRRPRTNVPTLKKCSLFYCYLKSNGTKYEDMLTRFTERNITDRVKRLGKEEIKKEKLILAEDLGKRSSNPKEVEEAPEQSFEQTLVNLNQGVQLDQDQVQKERHEHENRSKELEFLLQQANKEIQKLKSDKDGLLQQANEEIQKLKSDKDGLLQQANEEIQKLKSDKDGLLQQANEEIQKLKSDKDGLLQQANEEIQKLKSDKDGLLQEIQKLKSEKDGKN